MPEDLAETSREPPEGSAEAECHQVADVLAQVAPWPGFAASVASKVLNLGTYMNPSWAEQRSLTDSVYAVARIREAIDWIAFDLTRRENDQAWERLAGIEPGRTRV